MKRNQLFDTAAKCLTLDEFPSRRDIIFDGFFSGEIPINDFVRFCDAHLVLPSVYLKLRKHDLMGVFPPELVEHLEDIYLGNKNRNNEILGQVEEINFALNKKGIKPVYLKGVAHLLDGLYADPGERLNGDIDFLVEEEDYFEAAGVLKGLGYDFWWLHGEVPEWKHGGVGTPEHHFHTLVREDVPAAVELHRIPVARRYSEQFTTDMVFSRKKEIAGKENCCVPCDEHKAIHNFIHSQLANSGYRLKSTSLRDVYDLYLISKRVNPEVILPEIEARDKASGYFLFAASALGLGHKFYATENKKAKRHSFLSRLALEHPRMGSMYRKILKLGDLIFRSYLGGIIKAVYCKSSREHVIRRIKDPRWYRDHLAKLKEKFLK